MISEILAIVGIIIFALSMIVLFLALFLIGNITSIKTKDVTYSVDDGYEIKKLRDGYVINGNGKDNYFIGSSDIEEVERGN